MKYRFIIYAISFVCLSCKTKLNSVQEFYKENDSINLYAFIGEKIDLIQFDANREWREFDSLSGETIVRKSISMDAAFNAKYKVHRNVFNRLNLDTLDFKAYDHYGRPGFEQHEFVLLYISKDEKTGEFYHQKYQYDAVKRKSSGKWKGKTGKSIKKLFDEKKNGVLKARQVF